MRKNRNPHAVALGRKGGESRSPEKLAAVRVNGRLGGRPPKFEIGETVRVNWLAPSDFRERIGIIASRGPGRAEYFVRFNDGRSQIDAHLMSWWLDER
jgi:hypothetical protein